MPDLANRPNCQFTPDSLLHTSRCARHGMGFPWKGERKLFEWCWCWCWQRLDIYPNVDEGLQWFILGLDSSLSFCLHGVWLCLCVSDSSLFFSLVLSFCQICQCPIYSMSVSCSPSFLTYLSSSVTPIWCDSHLEFLQIHSIVKNCHWLYIGHVSINLSIHRLGCCCIQL